MPLKLTFHQPHASISALSITRLPDFTLITGANGVGKSHLLQAISQGNIHATDDSSGELVTGPLLTSSSLVPVETTSGRIDSSYLQSALFDHQRFNRHMMNMGENPEESQKRIRASLMNHLRQRGFHPQYIAQLEASVEKSIDSFTPEDFQQHVKLFYSPSMLLQSSIADTFINYGAQRESNDLLAFYNTKYGEVNPALSDEQFRAEYGPEPWVLFNEALQASQSEYELVAPSRVELKNAYRVRLQHKNGHVVGLEELSSGEKTLFFLVNQLYAARLIGDKLSFPQLLLLDEPDAALHPALSKFLISFLHDELCSKHGCKVIMTTHSPSSVALGPENSLFIMRREDERRLEQVSKDKALSLLTEGVPTLSVRLENRRTVVVESKYDVTLYTRFFELLKTKKHPTTSLTFVNSGVVKDETASCDKVKEVVTLFRNGGNGSVFGILDWDTRNNPSDDGAIKILGHQSYYSIENLALDPFMLSLYLHIKNAKNANRALGSSFLPSDFFDHKDDVSFIQQVVNQVCEAVARKHDHPAHSAQIQHAYVGGQSVSLPSWYATTKGHTLEDQLISTFLQLSDFKSEPKVKGELLQHAFPLLPDFIPQAVWEVFNAIISART